YSFSRAYMMLCFMDIVHCSCPAGFDLVRDGECRGYYARITESGADTRNVAISKCNEIQGQPIIIHNEKDQSYWISQTLATNSVIGLVCNNSTKRWEWVDGSAVVYMPTNYNWGETYDHAFTLILKLRGLQKNIKVIFMFLQISFSEKFSILLLRNKRKYIVFICVIGGSK
ncbi:hypothetical protein PENTCL1PPCAC_21626, partial [Pristionchus entomophagus]